jgi:hypothetical protein
MMIMMIMIMMMMMMMTEGNRITLTETCPSSTLSTTNTTHTGLGMNAVRRGEMKVANRLKDGTVGRQSVLAENRNGDLLNSNQ